VIPFHTTDSWSNYREGASCFFDAKKRIDRCSALSTSAVHSALVRVISPKEAGTASESSVNADERDAFGRILCEAIPTRAALPLPVIQNH